ncbi:T9SS type A sorting domain-containing protein [Gracilimonas mengyeensis]|nr:T9SS type A sorting domain-containing protein [Gracilimonas mengyeensis]
MKKATISRYLMFCFAFALFIAAKPASAQDNIIVDGDFAEDELPAAWTTYIHADAGVSAQVGVTDGEAAVTSIEGAGGATWHVQFNQILTTDQIGMLVPGEVYTVQFDARSNVEGRPIRMFFGEDGGSFTALAAKDTTLTTSMETYTYKVEVTQAFSAMKLGFELGLSNDDFYLDNVEVLSSGEPLPPNPEFGDNKILFVEGPNVLIPDIDGEVVEDVVEEGNLVHRITGGAFFQLGYFWDMGGSGGIDFTQNMADVDTVYFRIRINPADHTDAEGNLRSTGSLVLADVTNGTNSNLQWGISYPFSGELYDNEWHELAIPLPKPTIAEHDSAKKGLDLDGNPLPESEQYSEEQMNWIFPTAWNGEADISPNDPELGGDPEWENLGRIALSLGNNQSGTFYVDDFYVGSKSATDLSEATSLPDLPGNVSATAENDSVRISWEHDSNSNIYNYELFYSGSEIADIEDEGVKFIGSFRTTDDLEFAHFVERPHPSVSGVTYHYAVVPTTQYSVKSSTNFASESVVASGQSMPYIFELSEEQELQIISDLESGTINAESWPTDEYKPFELTSDEADVSEADASAKIWMAFGRAEGYQTLYIYTEAMDDDILAGPANAPSDMLGTTIYPDPANEATWIPTIADEDIDLEWNYYLKDQLKIHFGTYDVDFVTGTTNEFRSRGEKPDYFLSLQPKVSPDDLEAGPDGMLTRFWVTEHNYEDPDVVYNTLYYNSNHQFTFSSLYENIMQGETRVGWKAMVAFDVSDLLVATDGGSPIDAPLEFPSQDELKYLPISFELWDKDSGDTGNWWENPSHVIAYPTAIAGGGNNEWEDGLSSLGTVAMAGSGLPTSNEVTPGETPRTFSLEQNYPNPFNPTTNIAFTLPKAAEVNLTIFNILGQKVATLVNAKKYASGNHKVQFDASSLSSGMYVYRLEAGSYISTKKMMLIK